MRPKWARLIDRYKFEGHVGLTPSFLLGALREPPGAVVSQDRSFVELYALLQSMRDEARGADMARVFECQNIEQPIVTFSGETNGYPISGLVTADPILYVWPWTHPTGPIDFAWLFETLWQHFRDAINDGRFSYDRRTKRFVRFSDDDFAFIERALKLEEEDE
jgi:hypothetical protein